MTLQPIASVEIKVGDLQSQGGGRQVGPIGKDDNRHRLAGKRSIAAGKPMFSPSWHAAPRG